MSIAAAMQATAQDHSSITGPTLISDGDTLSYSIRIFGIDTPEKLRCCRNVAGSCYRCGKEAAYLSQPRKRT